MEEKRTVFGLGFVGNGNFNRRNNRQAYDMWSSLIRRANSLRYKEDFNSYSKVIACEEWHNFQNFAEWFYNNYDFDKYKGFELDKDILIKGNKVYSPETCCFVPKEINYLFTKRQNKRGDYPIGVTFKDNKFRATSTQNRKQIFLGYFDTPQEAFDAYKLSKEQYIKEVADKWRDLIDPRVYQAMYNYEVEITD